MRDRDRLTFQEEPDWMPWSGAAAIVDASGKVVAWTTSDADDKRAIREAIAALKGAEPVASGEADYQAHHRAQEAEFADDPADLPGTLAMLERWGPEAFPANEQGQVSFGRALLDSAASAIRKHLASPPPAVSDGWRKQPWMTEDDWNGGRWMTHEEALGTIRDAASVSTLSYEEAVLVYARGRGFIVDDAPMMASPLPTPPKQGGDANG